MEEPRGEPRQTSVNLRPYPHVDPSDRSDPAAWLQSKEQAMREQVIAKERVNRLRLQIVECYRKEGVNHYVNCKHLTTKYAKLIRDHTYGMLKPPSTAGAEEDEE